MKYLILALLAAFSITASAGKPTKDQVVEPVEATTIKSSKSNSSEREQAPVEATTVKGSRSNSDERAGKPTKDQVVQPAEATTVKGSKSNSDNRLQSNPTVTQGLKVSREKAPDTDIGPAASPKAPVPKVDAIKLNSSRSNIYREKAPDVTAGATPEKERSNAEPEKPFKF